MSQIPSPYDPTHGHHHQEHMHSEHCGLCRIELEHVSVSAGGDTLLSDVNMHIHCGQLTALVGPNGAGKTTLVRALLSQIPHTGQIRHMDNQERPLRSVRTGYVPQQLPFDKQMPVTVTDFLAASLTRRPVWTGVGKKRARRCWKRWLWPAPKSWPAASWDSSAAVNCSACCWPWPSLPPPTCLCWTSRYRA